MQGRGKLRDESASNARNRTRSRRDNPPFSQTEGFAGPAPSAGLSSGGGFGRAASLVADTAGELAKGAGSKVVGKFQDKVNQTAGGRLPSSIREDQARQSHAEWQARDPKAHFRRWGLRFVCPGTK